MALILSDRVKVNTTTTGTGTVVLASTAPTGYQSFAVIGDANTTYYTIAGQTTSEWEVGIGTYYLANSSLSRTTILASSAANAAVTFSAGTKDVFVTYPAEKSVNIDATGNVSSYKILNGSINNTPIGATTANTGAFSTVSATGVITSTVATGTAPFTVASTTQVANLNVATAGTATTATNIAGGALGSVPYQNAAGTTLFLAGTTSATPNFVTSTGTGAATQAPTLTSSTGSGSVVLATSPTLVTPALGTPASGTLTNCTFPTLNQNTSGTAAGLSVTLVATSGGTGQSTYAIGDLLQGGTTNTLTKLAAVATGNALISGGVTTASSWGKIGLTTHVSGTLPIANGGTNSTATPTAGGVVYGTGTAYAFNAAGTAGQVLTSGGAGAPTWAAASAGTVTSVSGTGTASGLTLSGTVTTSGSLTLSGTVPNTAVAWVQFTGGTGSPTIVGSFNVSSVTRTGLGRHVVNFTSSLTNSNYAVIASSASTQSQGIFALPFYTAPGTYSAPSTSSFAILYEGTNGAAFDIEYANIAVFD